MSVYDQQTRKLNRWGFKNCTPQSSNKGHVVAIYYHEMFLRDWPDMCNGMTAGQGTKRNPSTSSKGSDSAGQPQQHSLGQGLEHANTSRLEQNQPFPFRSTVGPSSSSVLDARIQPSQPISSLNVVNAPINLSVNPQSNNLRCHSHASFFQSQLPMQRATTQQGHHHRANAEIVMPHEPSLSNNVLDQLWRLSEISGPSPSTDFNEHHQVEQTTNEGKADDSPQSRGSNRSHSV